MTGRNDQIPGCLGLLLILLGVWLLVAIVRAQPTDEALALARLTVHEAGWDSPADVGLIHGVLRGIQERDRVSFRRAVELASPPWARGATAPRWALALRADGEQPRWWAAASWPAHRDRWLALLEHARRVVGGEIPGPCREPPRVWGSPEDVARGLERGRRWIDAGCEGTRNLGGRWE